MTVKINFLDVYGRLNTVHVSQDRAWAVTNRGLPVDLSTYMYKRDDLPRNARAQEMERRLTEAYRVNEGEPEKLIEALVLVTGLNSKQWVINVPPKPQVTEARRVFKGDDVIKVDPDRSGHADVVDAILPTIVRMSYISLLKEKEFYDQRGSDDQEDHNHQPFKFNADQVVDEAQRLVRSVIEKLENLSTGRLHDVVDQIKSSFPTPLDK